MDLDTESTNQPTHGGQVEPLHKLSEAELTLRQIEEQLQQGTAAGREAAQGYIRRGFKVVPIPRGAKGPRTKGWQQLRITEENLDQHFPQGNPRNVGILLGEPSGGLVDVDLDCPEAVTAAKFLLPQTNMVHGRAGKPLSHYWYRLDQLPKKSDKLTDPDGSVLVELRATGQTVVPPSTHKAGPYQWDRDGDPAPVEFSRLRLLVRSVAVVALFARHWPKEGSRQEAAMALAGALARAGWPPECIRNFLYYVATAANDDEVDKRLAVIERTVERVQAGEEVTGWPRLAELLGEEVVKKAREWLSRIQNDCSLIGKGSAAINESGEEPTAIITPEGDLALSGPFPAPVPISHLATTAASQVEWLWHGYLPLGGITLLIALWKSGKTTLLTHLLKAVCDGEAEFCGQALRPRKVLVVTQESDAVWNKRRREHGLRDEVIHFQRGPDDYPQPFRTRPTLKQWEQLVAHLARCIKERGYGLVVIDPLADFWPVTNENDAGEVTDALLPLRQLTHAGACVLLLHHPRKGDGAEGTAARGSGQLPGFVDVLVEMRRTAPNDPNRRDRVITGLSRYDETPRELVVELTPDGYVAKGTRQEATKASRYDKVGGLLPVEPPGLTVDEVHDSWPTDDADKPSERKLRDVLKEGVEQGLWRSEGAGHKNDPVRYWRAA